MGLFLRHLSRQVPLQCSDDTQEPKENQRYIRKSAATQRGDSETICRGQDRRCEDTSPKGVQLRLKGRFNSAPPTNLITIKKQNYE